MTHTTRKPLLTLLAAIAISLAAVSASSPSAHACGGPYRPPSEATQASWAVRAHFTEQAPSIQRVDVQLANKSRAAAVVHFTEKSKLPPLHLRLVKSEGRWKVVAAESWRA